VLYDQDNPVNVRVAGECYGHRVLSLGPFVARELIPSNATTSREDEEGGGPWALGWQLFPRVDLTQ